MVSYTGLSDLLEAIWIYSQEEKPLKTEDMGTSVWDRKHSNPWHELPNLYIFKYMNIFKSRKGYKIKLLQEPTIIVICCRQEHYFFCPY